MSTGSGLDLRLFGYFEARIGNAPLLDLRLREGERLLAYLTLHHGIAVPYRTLAQVFWPAEARMNPGIGGDFPSTRQAIRSLRHALRHEGWRLASVGKGIVQLDLDGAVVDVVEFDRLIRSDEPADWRRALDHFRGPLLAGWQEKWAVDAAARRENSRRRLLARLADDAESRNAVAEADEYLGTLIASDPENVESYQARRDALRAVRRAAAHSPETLSAMSSPNAPQITILYKKRVEPDESVVRKLKSGLNAAGYRVYCEQDITGGIESSLELERRVMRSTAVIAVLSEASALDEMLEYEIERSWEASQTHDAVPRIIPIRVSPVVSFREGGPLARILDPLPHLEWRSNSDDEQLLDHVLDAVRSERPALPTVPADESLGAAVPLDSQFYVQRSADRALSTALARRDSVVLLKGARQAGKTSLLARGLQEARESGLRVVLTDFQKLNQAQFESPDSLCLALANGIAIQLELDVSPRQFWDPDFGPNINLELFLRRHILSAFSEPLVWGMDEVDRLFSCGFGSEIFGLFRSWHNERSLNPSGPWGRLTMVIAYATEAHLFITDLNQSPFNVGTRVLLDDFSHEQVADLNRRYREPLKNDAEIDRFCALVGGQPYLVRRGLQAMTGQGLSLEHMEGESDRDEGPFGDHLRRMLVALSRAPELVDLVRCILAGQSGGASEHFYRLRTAGLLVGESSRDAHFRCRLYANYLARHLA